MVALAATVALAGCETSQPAPSSTTTITITVTTSTTALTTTTLGEEALREVDLAAALLTLEDLPEGSQVSVENVDYLASGIPRIILCGEDVRRELDALTGRFSQFYGPEGVFLWVSPAVSSLPGDNAHLLLDRLEEVAQTCDRTWEGAGFEGADTEYEVLGTYDLPALGDQRLAIEMAHRSADYADATLHLVYIRRGQFITAFLAILDEGSDEGMVLDLAERADEKLAAAIDG